MNEFDILQEFMRKQGVAFEVIEDKAVIMRHFGGRIAPQKANAIQVQQDGHAVIITNVFEAVDYLRQYGLVRI